MAIATLGFGPAARSIDEIERKYRGRLRESATLGIQPALEELDAVWEECRTPDWDGFGALPVEPVTLNAARELLDSLPYGFPLPSIGAEPDGQLTLEWRKSPARLLSVSVDPAGYLHYAGIYGTDRCYGTLTFFSKAPSQLLRLVQDL